MQFTACASSSANLLTSNIPLQNKPYTILGTAETTVFWYTLDLGIFAIPLGKAPLEKAEKNLLNRFGGDALINLRYWTEQVYVPVFYFHRFHLKADVIKFD